MQSEEKGHNPSVSPEKGRSRRDPPKNATQRKIENELLKLQRLTKGTVPAERRRAIMPLLGNIAFLKVKLDDARRELRDESIFSYYDNGGGQAGLREHPGFSAYNKLLTTFARSVKQVTDLMPAGAAEADELADFLDETRQR